MTNLQKLSPSNLDTVPERLTNMRKIIEKKKKYPLFFLRNLQMVPYGFFFFIFFIFFYNSRCHPFHTILNRALIQTKKLHKRDFQNLS